jgi:hypothetical protein
VGLPQLCRASIAQSGFRFLTSQPDHDVTVDTLGHVAIHHTPVRGTVRTFHPGLAAHQSEDMSHLMNQRREPVLPRQQSAQPASVYVDHRRIGIENHVRVFLPGEFQWELVPGWPLARSARRLHRVSVDPTSSYALRRSGTFIVFFAERKSATGASRR